MDKPPMININPLEENPSISHAPAEDDENAVSNQISGKKQAEIPEKIFSDCAEAVAEEKRKSENMRFDRSGYPSYKSLPYFMKGKEPVPNPPSQKHPKRANFHDYRAPGEYMITATQLPGSPILSKIPDLKMEEIKKGNMIIPILSSFGEIIKEEILSIPSFHPELQISRFVIMPDHIHIVVNVKKRLNRKLGNELAGFFGACSKRCSNLLGLDKVRTLFAPFHDRLILTTEQLDRCIKYVEDNPRRYLYKKKMPDLFRRYLHLEICGHEYAAFGNIFLLKKFYLLPIRIHRYWSQEEFRRYDAYCRAEIDKGAIPITPAIHSAERAIVEYGREKGDGIILLQDSGFEERFKPSGRNFELCCEGKLLLLAPWPDNIGRKSTSGYAEFHRMNDLANAIASLSSSDRFHLKFYR